MKRKKSDVNLLLLSETDRCGYKYCTDDLPHQSQPLKSAQQFSKLNENTTSVLFDVDISRQTKIRRLNQEEARVTPVIIDC